MYKIYVRWNIEGDDQHRVELTKNGTVIQSSQVFWKNLEMIYGYCRGTVDTLRQFGIEIDMPQCITDYYKMFDMTRED